jgi:hypothetical protein
MAVSQVAVQFAEALAQKFEGEYLFSVDGGRKFDRIVQRSIVRGEVHGGSVHAFVEKESGKLCKAGGWSAPQKDKNGPAYRYDLSTPEGFAQALDAADMFGGYLYAGRS